MKKYKCKDCNTIIAGDELGVIEYWVGYYGEQGAYQYYIFCPNCGSDCIDEYEE